MPCSLRNLIRCSRGMRRSWLPGMRNRAADRSRTIYSPSGARNLADLGDLAGGKDFFHGRHSTIMFGSSPPGFSAGIILVGPRRPGEAGRAGARAGGQHSWVRAGSFSALPWPVALGSLGIRRLCLYTSVTGVNRQLAPQDEKKAHTLGNFCEFAVLRLSGALPALRRGGYEDADQGACRQAAWESVPENPWR